MKIVIELAIEKQIILQSNHMHEHSEIERIYIDPQRLLKLKKQRKAFKQVASIFQPPPELISQPDTSTNTDRFSPTQKYKDHQIINSEMLVKNRHPNVDFIFSLIGEIKPEQVVCLQQGDCLNMRTEQKWLLLQGEVRVTGVGGRMFCLKEGSILFINNQTSCKIKEVICLKGTRVMKISQEVYQRMRNYIFLKNAQKIKYLKYCPFFIWTDQLSQDLAANMYMQVYEKGEQIYSRGDSAKKIMFVKEGVVLLQRMYPLTNTVLKQYQNHYERSEISQSQSTLVVKKGMVFGIDGILLKDTFEDRRQINPQLYDKPGKKQIRVYSARTLGRTEVYVLQKQILEGLFDVNDLLSASNFPRELTKGDLQKICSDYADMVVRHRSLPKIVQTVASKELTLDSKIEANKQELLQKKTKVRQVRQQEELTKRHSIAKIISDCKQYRISEINNSVVLQHHFNQKLGLDRQQEDGLALPALSSHLKKRRTSKEIKRGDQGEKYILQWLKGSELRQSRQQGVKVSAKKSNKLSMINIRSYRSIIPNIS